MSFNPLHSAQFLLAAHRIAQLPSDEGAEVAFAGRSNAGKSSALNALTDHKGLARTSKTPGRTQQIVAFGLPGPAGSAARRLIDLPGYGYAKVPESMRQHWRSEIDAYLRQRRSLRGVILLVDIRHPLKPFDQLMLDFCAGVGLPCHVLLTKADKLSRGQAAQALTGLERTFQQQQRLGASAQLFSAQARWGLEDARDVVAGWLAAVPAPLPA